MKYLLADHRDLRELIIKYGGLVAVIEDLGWQTLLGAMDPDDILEAARTAGVYTDRHIRRLRKTIAARHREQG